MNKIKCIIVEDEIPAANELEFLLSQYDFIEVIAKAHDGINAERLVKEKGWDVAFLDINIPMGNGMDLGKIIKTHNKDKDIVFVTAYEVHAVEAFEIEAFDYVLKPFEECRLAKTINRLKDKYDKPISDSNDMQIKIDKIINKLQQEEQKIKKIPCEEKGIIKLIDVNNIYYCLIEEEKTYVKTRDRKFLTSNTLHEIESKTNLFRAHKSYLVNIDKISEMYSWFNGTYKLIINDAEKSEIPLSRNNVKKMKELIGLNK